jgi:hypothetical protein
MTENSGESSKKLLELAARALRNPETLTEEEIKSLAGSVIAQAPNKK